MGGLTLFRKYSALKERTIYLPRNPGNGMDLRYIGDDISHIDKDRRRKRYCQTRKGDRKSRGEYLNQGSTVTRLTRMEAIQMMKVKTSPTGRKVEAITAKQRTADGCPDEMGIPTRMAILETRPLQYQNVWTSRVVVVTRTWMVASVARERARASFG